ncbi:MAG: c-type cytochrome [Planctomycetota bacterium]|nr:c-type cytochrome [Planctomycetota bacterium]
MKLPIKIAAGVCSLAATLLLLDGCRGPDPAAPRHSHFELNEAEIAGNPDLAEDPEARIALSRALTETFGSLAVPRYLVLDDWRRQGFDPNRWPMGESAEEGAEALGEEQRPSLAESAALYAGRCARCHGFSGGGNGPMAARLDTRPRDYRHGVFKKTPLAHGSRPRHEDLVRMLADGISGTAMPSWGPHLTVAEIAGLADFVRLLAIRGETERMAIIDYDAFDGFDQDAFRGYYELVVTRWLGGGEQLILPGHRPEATPERIAHGESLFLDPRGAGCVRCHGREGHGDGEASLVPDPLTGEPVPFLDEWGNPIRPRDLVCSPLRFGERPEDLFRRIHEGINGTPMPAHGGLLVTEPDGTRHSLNDEDIWDLVFYVQSLR